MGELLFGYGRDSGGGWAVARLTCISNLEHSILYISHSNHQNIKFCFHQVVQNVKLHDSIEAEYFISCM